MEFFVTLIIGWKLVAKYIFFGTDTLSKTGILMKLNENLVIILGSSLSRGSVKRIDMQTFALT